MKMHNNSDIIAKALDASWLRSEIINNNIANNDTPGYKRKDVLFESYLEQALGSTGKISEKRLNNLSPTIFNDNTNLSYRIDGNNVNVDTEMAYLVQNQIKYNTLVSQVNYNFNRLKMVLGR